MLLKFSTGNSDVMHNSVLKRFIKDSKALAKLCIDRTTVLYYKLRYGLVQTMNEETSDSFTNLFSLNFNKRTSIPITKSKITKKYQTF